jgi:hypothetical protein
MGIIYKFTSPVEKSYIGQSIYEFEKRYKEHIYDARSAQRKNFKVQGCIAFWQALMKYGPENFETEILLECDDEDLDYYEKEMIEFHNTLSPNGYNLTAGGNSNKIISQETKDKISINTRIAMQNLGTKLKRTKASEGCPLYVGYYTYRQREGFRIQAHPKCSHKEFDISTYKTLNACKKAAIDYIKKLDSGEIEHTKPQKKGNDLPSGITEVNGGYRVQFIINKVKFVKCFYRKDRSKEENYKLALEFRLTADKVNDNSDEYSEESEYEINLDEYDQSDNSDLD